MWILWRQKLYLIKTYDHTNNTDLKVMFIFSSKSHKCHIFPYQLLFLFSSWLFVRRYCTLHLIISTVKQTLFFPPMFSTKLCFFFFFYNALDLVFCCDFWHLPCKGLATGANGTGSGKTCNPERIKMGVSNDWMDIRHTFMMKVTIPTKFKPFLKLLLIYIHAGYSGLKKEKEKKKAESETSL